MRKLYLSVLMIILSLGLFTSRLHALTYEGEADNIISLVSSTTNGMYMGTNAYFVTDKVDITGQGSGYINWAINLYDDSIISKIDIETYDNTDTIIETLSTDTSDFLTNVYDMIQLDSDVVTIKFVVITSETSYTYEFTQTKNAFLTNSTMYSFDYLLNVDTYADGQDDMFNNGSTANGYTEVDSYDYNAGQDDMWDQGSDAYGYDESNSYDYISGQQDYYLNGSVASGWPLESSFDYDVAYTQGQDDMFNNGSETFGYVLANAYDYILGYDTGQDDMYDNGSVTYGYTPDSSYDYDRGLNDGKQVNVNAGTINFMESFETWIVPAIVVVILLGGFMTIAVKKRNQD